ncbi:DNA cytosine methyltransferase [Parasaccharibacter apium]|uniref:DNA cytosine methyltransferase n=1 Tax=Parasaccharibacter apium TaxID=1510841 RepID=UPI0030025512
MWLPRPGCCHGSRSPAPVEPACPAGACSMTRLECKERLTAIPWKAGHEQVRRMTVFYNEWDKGAASWLSRLTEEGHLPSGTVDIRSITELMAEDLQHYEQAHFFAGIGGWPLALRWAGLEGVPGIWTGSPPCQPFPVAGLQKGADDDRHLAPVWLALIRKCLPAIVFGEQVAAAIKTGWLDNLFSELEAAGYACGAAVLPACSVGAPHLRNRLFFGAVFMGHADHQREPAAGARQGSEQPGRSGQAGFLADAYSEGPQRRCVLSERADKQPVGQGCLAVQGTRQDNQPWGNPDWLGCRDGKLRPVEPGSFPLADGIPARVGRLRAYGNAVVPQVAAAFIEAFMGAVEGIELGMERMRDTGAREKG